MTTDPTPMAADPHAQPLSRLAPLLPVHACLAHLFSKSSMQWYVRKNKARLVEAGALLLHCGRWHVDLTVFGQVVHEIAVERARRHLDADADSDLS
jgi:hypothetical protein